MPNNIKDKKIDKEKLEQATKYIAEIMENVARFEKIFSDMSGLERSMMGGIAVSITSPWAKAELNGFVATDNIAAFLINRLRIGFESSMQKSAQKQLKEAQMMQPISTARADNKPN